MTPAHIDKQKKVAAGSHSVVTVLKNFEK